MSLAETIQGKLVFLTAVPFQFMTYLVIEMKGIAQNGELDTVLVEEGQQSPEIRMKDGVSSGDVKIRGPAIYLAEIKTVIKGRLHLVPGHGLQAAVIACGKDIAVLASLVTLVSDVPLKGKEGFHVYHLINLWKYTELRDLVL